MSLCVDDRLVCRSICSGRAENLVPIGIRSRTVQPVAQSLYRLSYMAHNNVAVLTRTETSCEPKKLVTTYMGF